MTSTDEKLDAILGAIGALSDRVAALETAAPQHTDEEDAVARQYALDPAARVGRTDRSTSLVTDGIVLKAAEAQWNNLRERTRIPGKYDHVPWDRLDEPARSGWIADTLAALEAVEADIVAALFKSLAGQAVDLPLWGRSV